MNGRLASGWEGHGGAVLRAQVPLGGERIGCRFEQIDEGFHAADEGERGGAGRDWAFGVARKTKGRVLRIDGVGLGDGLSEAGEVADAFGGELRFPFQGGDDLRDELREPGEGTGFTDRDGVGFFGQEVGALGEDDRLEMEFDGLTVGGEHGAEVEVRDRARVEVEQAGELSSRGTIGAGVEEEIVNAGLFPFHGESSMSVAGAPGWSEGDRAQQSGPCAGSALVDEQRPSL